MATVRIIQSSFASGELSPELYGRVDLQQYANGLKECKNFIVKPHGGLVNRSGFEHVCTVKDSTKAIRLIPFNFNTEQTYILEFGNQYMRVIANGGLVTESSVNIVATSEADPVEVEATGCAYQDGDHVYIDDVGYATSLNGRWFSVTRVDDDNFTLQDLAGNDIDGTGIGVGADGTVERAYVITTPYLEAELPDLDYTQSADTMTIVHPNWTPRELGRTGHTAWTLAEVTFLPTIGKPQSLAVDNGSGNFTYAVTAVSEENGEESLAATVTSTHSLNISVTWAAVDGASGYNVYRDDGSSGRKTGFIGTTSSLLFIDPGSDTSGRDAVDEIDPEWSISPPEAYAPFGGNPIEIDDVTQANPGVVTTSGRAISAATAADPVEITTTTDHCFSTGDSIYIYGVLGMTEINDAWYTITVADPVGAPTVFTLDDEDGTLHTPYTSAGTATLGHGYSDGDRVYIDDGSDMSEANSTWYTVANSDDIDTFELTDDDGDDVDTSGYTAWTAGGNVEKYDGNDNCPSCVTYYEQRLVFAATNNGPQKIWMSQSAAFHNMNNSRPSRDSDAIIFTIASQKVNRIHNLIPMRDLIVLTAGGEWRANGGESEVMTATGGLAVRQQTDYGSGNLPAIVAGNTTIYYQDRGPALRTIAYSFADDQYMGVDLSILSQHLLAGYSLSEWAYAQAPFGVIWCVRNDGALLGLTYQHEHKVWAWHRHETEGEFESVSSILEDSQDAVYAVVKRDIDGTDVRFIERLRSRHNDDMVERATSVRDGFFVDGGLTLDDPADITGITAAEPPVVTIVTHGLSQDDYVDISDVEGMTEVNDHQYKANLILAAAKTITGISQATEAVVTSAAHGLNTGDRVYITGLTPITSGSMGEQLNDRDFTVTRIGPGSYSLDYEDTTGCDAYSAGGEGEEISADTFELADATTGDDIDGAAYTAYESGGYAREAVTTIRGLDHLEGETVTILANGMVHPDATVSGGAITLDDPASIVHIGFGFTSQIETLTPDIPSQQGTLQGTRQAITEVILRVHDSVGFWAGPDEDNLKEAAWRSEYETYDQPVAMYTGDTEPLGVDPDWDRGTTVVIRQDAPLPLAINAIISEVKLGS